MREHVQLTPRGSRMHRFEHTSPGGTSRLEQYTSPAGVRATREIATREQRAGCWSRIAQARAEVRYNNRAYMHTCSHCGLIRRVASHGRMHQHGIGPSLSQQERAEYRESEAFAEHGWLCPGSHVYYGPCDDCEDSEECADEDSRDESEQEDD